MEGNQGRSRLLGRCTEYLITYRPHMLVSLTVESAKVHDMAVLCLPVQPLVPEQSTYITDQVNWPVMKMPEHSRTSPFHTFLLVLHRNNGQSALYHWSGAQLTSTTDKRCKNIGNITISSEKQYRHCRYSSQSRKARQIVFLKSDNGVYYLR